MTVFDLLFILAFLTSVVTLATAAISAIRGRRSKAVAILGIWGVCAAAYLTIGIVVSALKPQRVLAVGEPWCFDDWCLTVDTVGRTPAASGTSYNSYNVGLRIFSRARRVTQRANGAWIYLLDEHGRRYLPEPDPSAVPLDVLLAPEESISTSRRFQVPAEERVIGLITGHGGAYCGPMSFLIVGASGCLFNKPPMIMLRIQ